MKVAIIVTGDELLKGLVQDSNSSYLAKKLTSIGFDIKKISICSDQKQDIKTNILKSAEIADIIFITGGLGPTKDDLSREAFAEALNVELKYSKKIETELKKRFSDYGSKMTANNLSQAYIPEGGESIGNEKGTAPALKLKKNNKTFYLLPGVPSELKYIFKKNIFSKLKSLNNQKNIIKELNFIGIGESSLASKVDELTLDPALKISYQAGKAEVKLRLEINNNKITYKKAKEIIHQAENKIKLKFKKYFYGEGQQNIIDKLHSLLISQNLKIATAESFTGGMIAEKLTLKSGSSKYFLASIVAYNKNIKTKLLNIEKNFFNKHSVVSKECAAAMAKKAAAIFNSDLIIASTGAAGPKGHGGMKAGTMYIAIYFQGMIKTYKLEKNYNRELNKFYASKFSLFKTYQIIKERVEK